MFAIIMVEFRNASQSACIHIGDCAETNRRPVGPIPLPSLCCVIVDTFMNDYFRKFYASLYLRSSHFYINIQITLTVSIKNN